MKVVVGISGASGIILGYKTAHQLLKGGHTVHLVMSRDAALTAHEELGARSGIDSWVNVHNNPLLHIWKIQDFTAPIASGSYLFDAMAVVPCSMATLSAIAIGLSDNLMRRAADVALKERRKLIIVPRESPFSAIHLQNMLTLTHAGAQIVPPLPAWYTLPQTVSDIENFIVGRILDAIGIDANLYPRWGQIREQTGEAAALERGAK